MNKNTNSALENSQSLNQEWENYFNNTIIPQLFIDAQLILRKFSPPAMKQFSLTADEIGKHLSDIINHFRTPSLIEDINYVITHSDVLEKEVQTTDMRWYQMNIIPYIRGQDNVSNGVIVTFVEITARIKDLKEQEKLVLENERLLDTIVHDIKSPLGLLTTASGQLKKISDPGHEHFKSFLDIIETTVSKLVFFIDELSEHRKAEYENINRKELLNLESILEDVQLTLRDKIHDTGARFTFDLECKQIRFSRRELRSMLYNLIQNSLRYRSTDVPPEIMVKCLQSAEYIVISVRDNGIGIDKSKHRVVFDKYTRLNENTKGSGLGLHLIRQIILNAGGKIELDSEPGKGTEVRLFINAPPD